MENMLSPRWIMKRPHNTREILLQKNASEVRGGTLPSAGTVINSSISHSLRSACSCHEGRQLFGDFAAGLEWKRHLWELNLKEFSLSASSYDLTLVERQQEMWLLILKLTAWGGELMHVEPKWAEKKKLYEWNRPLEHLEIQVKPNLWTATWGKGHYVTRWASGHVLSNWNDY